MMQPCVRKLFTNVSEMSPLTYNRANNVIIKNAIIWNIIHNIFNLRDTDKYIHMYQHMMELKANVLLGEKVVISLYAKKK